MYSDSDFMKHPIYVLQFISPFESSNEKFLAQEITVSEARERLLRVYKTSASDFNTEVLPGICEIQIPWMQDAMSLTFKDSKIYMRDFIIAVISSVLYSISKELALYYDLLSSRDKDEIFCRVYASEAWLVNKATALDYHLGFRPEEGAETSLDFMKVPPYGSIRLLRAKGNEKLFMRYDVEGDFVEKGSLFMHTDKERLVIEALESRIDLSRLVRSGAMISSFCTHQRTWIQKFKFKWAKLGAIFSRQPIDEVRMYFAEKIAVYFEWLGTYCYFMCLAAAVGIVAMLCAMFLPVEQEDARDQGVTIAYSIFLCLWGASFYQYWIRKEKFLVWKWGTASMKISETQRGDFQGEFLRDEVTGHMKIIAASTFRHRLKRFLSYSLIFSLIIVVFIAVAAIFIIRYLISTLDQTTSVILCAILNAIQIKVTNYFYEKVAIWLNKWENLETKDLYYESLTVKMFVFKFVNSYASLFYIAFLKSGYEGCESGCLYELSVQLLVIFILNLIWNIVELGSPWLRMKLRIMAENSKQREVATESSTRTEMYSVEIEAKCEEYESPMDDYMEMVIQFGYVALFGASVPYLPLLALVEILLEIRVDAWKLCALTKRPHPDRCKDIGIWRKIILYVAYMGAISNAGIIFFASGAFDGYSLWDRVCGFMILEHFLIVGMYFIRLVIPEQSSVVQNGLLWGGRLAKERGLVETPTNKEQVIVSELDFMLKYQDVNYQD